MDAHEIVQKIKNAIANNQVTGEFFNELINWCNENTDKMDLSKGEYISVYKWIVGMLMKPNIRMVWDEKSVNIIVNYFAKDYLKKMNLAHNTSVEILSQEEFEKRNGRGSAAVCIANNDNTYTIHYSPTVKKMLLSRNNEQILRGFQTVFHEAIHSLQNNAIRKNAPSPEAYLMAMETLARRQAPDMYDKNYNHLLKENHAEKVGLMKAVEYIKSFAPDLYEQYDHEEIEARMKEYDLRFYDGKMNMFGQTRSGTAQIDKACSRYVSDHPEILEIYPILQYGFNMNGTKKTLQQLLDERHQLIEEGKSVEGVNKFYTTLANYKNYVKDTPGGTKEEILFLCDHIEQTGTEDEFIYDLLEHRLGRTKWEHAQIRSFMQEKRDMATKKRELQALEFDSPITAQDVGKAGFDASIEECDKVARDINAMRQTKEVTH